MSKVERVHMLWMLKDMFYRSGWQRHDAIVTSISVEAGEKSKEPERSSRPQL
jgi:hypothetical protein